MDLKRYNSGTSGHFFACLVAGFFLCLSGWGRTAPDALNKAAEYVKAGQWEQALSVLESIDPNTAPKAVQLKGLLQEYQALQQRRYDQRVAVFEEKCAAMEALDLTAADPETLLKAMDLFSKAWENAASPQRQALLERPIYATLRQGVQDRFTADVQAGHWDAAWSKWLQWLREYEPESFRSQYENLQQRRALANALRENPCDQTYVPYARVTRNAAIETFEILQNQYAEPVPFERLTTEGLGRLALLPEVLINPTLSYAVHADPNGFAGWTEQMTKLQAAPEPKTAAEMVALLDVLLAVNAETLKLPDGVIVAQFTEAALQTLDPYTEVVWPEGFSQFEKSLTGQFGGVGIRIKKDGDRLVIVSVIPDTPAAETILAADDVILAVDGQTTQEMTTDCAVKRISGPVGTSVSLTVRPAGTDKNEVVTVKRQKIVLPTVEGAQRADNGATQGHWDYFLDANDRIGYLQLNGFTDKTAEQARSVLEQLESRQVAGLIVDMRGNGGGLLSEATAFANLFIGDGLLLSSRGRDARETTWQAKPNAVARDYPLVILINEGSASASEVVAGIAAVRKPGQVTLIGQRTYGKGTVQEIVDLGKDGGRLKYTTACYYLPDNRPVPNRYKLEAEGRTDWGIAPTIEVPLYEYEQSRIRQIQLERRKQLMAKDPRQDAMHAESLVEQMLMTDAQLFTAVVVLKAQILTQL